jgi:hypothetical protein
MQLLKKAKNSEKYVENPIIETKILSYDFAIYVYNAF